MPRLQISRPIRPQVLPEHSIAPHGLEYDPLVPLLLLLLSALYIPTPSPILRPPQPRKLRAPTRAVRIDVHHETAHAVRLPRPLPVVMMRVVPSRAVLLDLEPLEHYPPS